MAKIPTSKKMPKTLTISQIEEKAHSLGLKTDNLPLAQYVRDIQLEESHRVCFGRSGGECSETDCEFGDHCLEMASPTSKPQQETAKQVQDSEQAASAKSPQETKAPVQASGDRLAQQIESGGNGADITQEMADIFSMVKNLEVQVESSTKLNEDLNSNFTETQQQLAEEAATRTELEERMKTVEVQAAQADTLSKDIAYTENERQKLSRLLAESHQQLQGLTGDYELLTNRIDAAEVRAKSAADLQKKVQTLQEKLETSDSQIENMQKQVNKQNNDMTSANETLKQEVAKRKKSEQVMAAVKERLKGLSL